MWIVKGLKKLFYITFFIEEMAFILIYVENTSFTVPTNASQNELIPWKVP